MKIVENLWRKTPLIYSSPLSEIASASVYLKLENLHPSYSFKFRGVSHFIKKAKETSGPNVHIVIASGGNAGLAAACASKSFGLKCSVFLPEGATSSTLQVLKRENADVVLVGKIYADAFKAAVELVTKEPKAVMVPPYDSPILWEGHSSMIHEIHEDLHQKPEAIFCSVGGGGLLGGVLTGCNAVGWDDVTIGAIETIGSNCFYESMALNGDRFNSVKKTLPENVNLVHNEEEDVYLAHLTSFSSMASGSLGASEPAAGVVKMALEHPGNVKTVSVPDYLSMDVLSKFAEDHNLLVELACATALVPAYHPPLFKRMMDRNTVDQQSIGGPVVVFIVCGGFKIDLSDAGAFKSIASQAKVNGGQWTVRYDDGKDFGFDKV